MEYNALNYQNCLYLDIGNNVGFAYYNTDGEIRVGFYDLVDEAGSGFAKQSAFLTMMLSKVIKENNLKYIVCEYSVLISKNLFTNISWGKTKTIISTIAFKNGCKIFPLSIVKVRKHIFGKIKTTDIKKYCEEFIKQKFPKDVLDNIDEYKSGYRNHIYDALFLLYYVKKDNSIDENYTAEAKDFNGEYLSKFSKTYIRPSGSDMWINCPSNPYMNFKYGKEKKTVFSEEGKILHELVKDGMKKILKNKNKSINNLSKYNGKQIQALDLMKKVYFSYFSDPDSRFEDDKYDKVDLEKKIITDFFTGTIDLFAYNEKKLLVLDYKFGFLPIQPTANQLIIYANLALKHIFEKEGYSVEIVEICIAQKNTLRTHTYTAECIKEMGLDIYAKALKSEKLLYMEDESDIKAGTHCWFCPAKDSCPLKENIPPVGRSERKIQSINWSSLINIDDYV